MVQMAADFPRRLQHLIAISGAGSREARWALQLIERKAAVARWRAGELDGRSTRLPGPKGRRPEA